MNKCVVITTDGCSVMWSEKCDAIKLLQAHIKFAIKCSYFSHALNVSITKRSKQIVSRNAFGKIIIFRQDLAIKNFVLKMFDSNYTISQKCQYHTPKVIIVPNT